MKKVIVMKKLSELYDVNSDVLIKDIKINSKEIEKGEENEISSDL